MAAGAARIAAQRQLEINKKKKKAKALALEEKGHVNLDDGRLDTSALLVEFKALTDDLDLESDQQEKKKKQSMINSFLSNLGWSWSSEETTRFCADVFDAIGTHEAHAKVEERSVSSGDLKKALQSQGGGGKFSEQEASVLMTEIDKNDDGSISYNEFVDAMSNMVEADKRRVAAALKLSTNTPKGPLDTAWRAKDACLRACTPPANIRKCYARIANHSAALVDHPKFEAGVIGTIVLVAIATFAEVEYSLEEYAPSHPLSVVRKVVSLFTLAVFTLESIAKLVSFGERPIKFFTDPDDGAFNTFDLTIVVVSYATMGSSGGGVAVMRLLRLVKLMNKLPALREILLGLVAGVQAVSSIMILMMLIMFFFSVVANLFFSKNDPAHFETVETGILSLFVAATLAGWGDVAKINYFGCDVYDGGVYVQMSDIEDQNLEGSNMTLPFTLHAKTSLGTFRKHVCTEPVAQPVATMAFFFMYTIMTAYIVLSLFISVITAAMFEVIEQKQREKAAYDLAHAESADQKRQRVMNNVNDPEFIANLNAFFGMAVSDAAEFSRIPMVADVQRFARRIATCPAFESSVMCAIGGVAIVEVIETNKLAGGIGLYIVQQMFLVFFTCEVVVKLVAQGVNAKDYFRDSWNRFDFTIVMLSYLELLPFLSTGGAVTVLRLLRLLRVLRMLNSFPRLQGVTKSLVMSFGQVNWVLLMILLINFIFALMAMMMFGTNDPQHFGSFSMTAVSIWMVETTDNWDTLMYTNMYGCADYGYYDVHGYSVTALPCEDSYGSGWYAALFFVLIVLLGGFIMPTVLVGVISVSFNESAQKIKTENTMRLREIRVVETARSWSAASEPSVSDKQLASLRGVFDALNVGDPEDSWGASLDQDELVPFLAYMCQTYLSEMTEEELTLMFQVIDTSGDGDVSWAEFLWFVLFLRHQYNAAQNGTAGASRSADRLEVFKHEYKDEEHFDAPHVSEDKDVWGLSKSERAHLGEALSPFCIDVEAVLPAAAQYLEGSEIERRAAVLYLLQTLGQLTQFDDQLPSLVRLASAPAPTYAQSSMPMTAGGASDMPPPPPPGSQWLDGPSPPVTSPRGAGRGQPRPSPPFGNADPGVGPQCETLPAGYGHQQPVETELDIYLCSMPPNDNDADDPTGRIKDRRGLARDVRPRDPD